MVKRSEKAKHKGEKDVRRILFYGRFSTVKNVFLLSNKEKKRNPNHGGAVSIMFRSIRCLASASSNTTSTSSAASSPSGIGHVQPQPYCRPSVADDVEAGRGLRLGSQPESVTISNREQRYGEGRGAATGA